MLNKLLIGILVLVCGYGIGVISYKYRLPPIPLLHGGKVWIFKQMEKDEDPKHEDLGWAAGFKDTENKVHVDCSTVTQKGTKVFLVFGQSNSANSGLGLIDPGKGVFNFNFFNGKCYEGKDPLLGASGNKASVWTRLGKQLIEEGLIEQILVAPIGVNSSSILSWKPGGSHFSRVEVAIRKLHEVGLMPTHLLWHQGEADAHQLTKEEYKESFWEMEEGIRALGVEAPLFVAVASICHNRGSEEIRQAQREIPLSRPNVYPGPNTDDMVYVWERRDSCHFSEEGLDKHAEMWRTALINSGTL